MKISRAILVSIVILPLLSVGSACSGNDSKNSNSANSNTALNDQANVEIVPQDDVEELGAIVRLPIVPEETIYIENFLNNANIPPDKRKLVAVLKFSNENAAQVVAQVEKHQPAAPADVDAEMWFPPELIAKSQETGDEYLKGTAYAADGFLQSPYTNGRLTRINETNYFVLELTSF